VEDMPQVDAAGHLLLLRRQVVHNPNAAVPQAMYVCPRGAWERSGSTPTAAIDTLTMR
jgi:hypothetical protein